MGSFELIFNFPLLQITSRNIYVLPVFCLCSECRSIRNVSFTFFFTFYVNLPIFKMISLLWLSPWPFGLYGKRGVNGRKKFKRVMCILLHLQVCFSIYLSSRRWTFSILETVLLVIWWILKRPFSDCWKHTQEVECGLNGRRLDTQLEDHRDPNIL